MQKSFSLPLNSSVLIGGSRSALPGAVPGSFLHDLIVHSHRLHVGCATGADRQVISFVHSFRPSILPALRVFAAFSQSGAGSFSGSAVSSVQSFAAAGGWVSWLAGGSLSVPLVARLMSRSLAALQGCAAAVFFQPGVGSLKVARAALKQGIPVLVCQQGCPVAPVLAVPPVVVSWFGMSFWLYQPAIQSALF